MGKQLEVPYYAQVGGNTCWKAVAKMVLEYMGLPITFNEQKNEPEGSAVKLLAKETKSRNFVADDSPFPNWNEIKEEIDADRLLIGCVADKPTKTRDLEVTGGHWIIISGYEESGNKIYVLDPFREFGSFWMDCPTLVGNGYCYQPYHEYAARYFQSTSYMPEGWNLSLKGQVSNGNNY